MPIKQRTEKQREANRVNYRRYYKRNKEAINATHRTRVICDCCGQSYNRQYYWRTHVQKCFEKSLDRVPFG